MQIYIYICKYSILYRLLHSLEYSDVNTLAHSCQYDTPTNHH